MLARRPVSYLVLFRNMRNSLFPETPLGGSAPDRVLESLRRVLPEQWSAELEVEPAGDLELHVVLSIVPPKGPRAKFVVEARFTQRGSADDAVQAAVSASARTGFPAVVFTNFANPALRSACLERGVGFADETGWVSLRSDKSPGLLLNLQGAQQFSGPRRASNIGRLDGPGASKVIRALWDMTKPVGVRELAAYAQVSPGTVAKVLPTLTEAGAVERDAAGALVRPNRWLLLDRWTQDYSFIRSNREVTWLLAPRGMESLDKAISRLPDSTTIVSTGSLGARNLLDSQLLSVTPLTLRTYYTDDPGRLTGDLGLRPSSTVAANVVLARPRDPSLLRPIGYGGSVVAVPPVQVLADLLTMGGRFPDEAEQLFDSLYPLEPRLGT